MPSLVPTRSFANGPTAPLARSGEGDDLERLFDSPHWYAVYTCVNREKQVAAQFVSRGIEHYLPLYESVREWSDRRVKLQMPLFPGYLFVETTLRDRIRILTVPGVVNLVSSAGQPLPLTVDVIERLRLGVQRVGAQPYPYLPVGQRVFISAGPLKGWPGVLVRHKAGARVVISIDLIQRAFIADVDVNDLIPDGPLLDLDSVPANEEGANAKVTSHRGKDFPFRTP